MLETDLILAQIEEIRQTRKANADLDWAIPETPEYLNDWGGSNSLQPVTVSSLEPLPDAIPLSEVQAQLVSTMDDYTRRTDDNILLVKVPAGAGKTHSAIEFVQSLARLGQRVIWCSSRHNSWDDLAAFPHFDDEMWYHWRSTQGEIAGAPTCRYAQAQERWTARGYKAFDLCLRLCATDRHLKVCPFRLQAKRKEPIIFAMHQHLTVGLSVAGFDVCIIDELPLGAFVNDRRIPMIHVNVGGAFDTLTRSMRHASADLLPGTRLAGKALLDIIGPELQDVYAHVEMIEGAVPVSPAIYSAEDVDKAPYFFALQMLNLLSPEHEAWKAGWPMWAERVWLTASNLHLLSRAPVWDKLPRRVIALDATAQADLYGMMFGRPIEEYCPNVKRIGKLYQATKALNGKYHLGIKDSAGVFTPSKSAETLVAMTRAIAKPYTSPSVICSKDVESLFVADWGEENVRHFGDLRGTNDLDGHDLLVVAGAPGPNFFAIIDIATALDATRRESFFTRDEEGNRHAIFGHQWREYRLSADGLQHAKEEYGEDCVGLRRRVGCYAIPTLAAIHRQLREDELHQAIHRARINVHEADVWLLTSIPTDEPVDRLCSTPPLAPDGIPWQLWVDKIEPWLNSLPEGKEIGYKDFEGIGIKKERASDGKWIVAIVQFLPDEWEIAVKMTKRARGRPTPTMIKPA